MLLQEESIWLKKSRCNWMIIGDRNTKFYHAFASSRHRANKVKGLHKDNGEWCTNPSVLCALASGFYSSLFTSDGANSSSYHIHGFFPRVEARQLDSLLAPIMDEENALAFDVENVNRDLVLGCGKQIVEQFNLVTADSMVLSCKVAPRPRNLSTRRIIVEMDNASAISLLSNANNISWGGSLVNHIHHLLRRD
ncbi:hypothetical protein V6N11_044407 [Hibiscus sabdariffa]|uniref:RNase H type-1 domain-containing protein n=1 Tax=Hibiscus sabdariffa TaxID=183260 RepID=A0ABR2RF34_9ROSI